MTPTRPTRPKTNPAKGLLLRKDPEAGAAGVPELVVDMVFVTVVWVVLSRAGNPEIEEGDAELAVEKVEVEVEDEVLTEGVGKDEAEVVLVAMELSDIVS